MGNHLVMRKLNEKNMIKHTAPRMVRGACYNFGAEGGNRTHIPHGTRF
jgi:hypothetical protein